MHRTQIVSVGALVFIGIVLAALVASSSSSSHAPNSDRTGPSVIAASNTSNAEAPSLPTEPPKPAMPPVSGQMLHPYDLLKNPFKLKGRLVLLELRSRPVLYDGTVVQYSGQIEPTFGKRFGFMALKLNRMIEEDQALYDIMGVEAGNSEGQMLGQLLVTLPSNTTELDLGRVWAVEPLGPVKGTNGFGATISIPSVRFWRYQTDQGVEQSAKPATQEASIPQLSVTQRSPAGVKESKGPWLSSCDDQSSFDPVDLKDSRAFLSDLQSSLRTQDSSELTALIDSPFSVNVQTNEGLKHKVLSTTQDFAIHQGDVFTPALKNYILQLDPSGCMTRDKRDFTMGGGMFWFHRSGSGTFKLFVVNISGT